MPPIAIAARARALALPGVPAELPARRRVSLGKSRLRRVLFWPAELMRLMALVYLLPVVIYAIGIPIAVAVNAAVFVAAWSWRGLWQ